MIVTFLHIIKISGYEIYLTNIIKTDLKFEQWGGEQTIGFGGFKPKNLLSCNVSSYSLLML